MDESFKATKNPAERVSEKWITDVDNILPLKSLSPSETSFLSTYLERNRLSFGSNDASFADLMWSVVVENPERLEPIKRFFENKVVIDIGAGSNFAGYEMAIMLGSKAYIAVEPFNTSQLRNSLREYTDHIASGHKGTLIPIAITSSDALMFLKQVPDNSVSLMSFGTDNLMFRDRFYNGLVDAEIGRCLSSEGAFLTKESTFYPLPADKQKGVKKENFLNGEIYHF